MSPPSAPPQPSGRFVRDTIPTLVRVGLAHMAAYRAEIFIWILTTTLPLVMFALWSSLAAEGPLGRFDGPTLSAYFLATLVVRQLASSWVVWELNELVRSGGLSPLLVRPIHPLWPLAGENLGALPIRVLVLVPVTIAWLALEPGTGARFALGALPLAAYAAAMSLLLTFLVQAVLGLMALYTQQSLGLQDAWFAAWALLSGYLIPLELVPGLADVARWLPFRAVGGVAVELALGLLDGRAAAIALGLQLAWIAAFAALLTWLWPRAMRRYEAHGQ
jgi:ABC-2 type transport system permease protein